jgi:tRNA(Ile)-lysidine synthase
MIHFNYKAHRTYRQFAAHFKELLGKRLPPYVIVACSGGADSIALADLMHRFACEHPVIPVIVHVNHRLRGAESRRDEKFVRAFCQMRNLPMIAVQAPVTKTGNVQTVARSLRYAALTAVAEHIKCPVILTAHHANDQAETVLQHLMRGSGPEALTGIHERRALSKKVEVLRPMLPLTRADIDDYIRNARLRFVTDRSNRSLKYTRNWIRKKVIPLLETQNPRVVEALCSVAKKCSSYSSS